MVFLSSFLVFLFFLYFAFQSVSPKKEKTTSQTDLAMSSFLALLPTPAPYPYYISTTEFPNLSAESIYAVDVDSMVTLYEKQADLPLLPASTTKIMTALIALENYSLDQILVYDGQPIEGNNVGLKQGEQMSVENLLYAALVGSGNEAAYTLASNYPLGMTVFVDLMNQKAQELHLLNTHFVNPMGLDQEGQYSTARDLALLSIEALKNPEFAKIVGTFQTTINDVSGEHSFLLKNTNELVSEDNGFKGVKTGWTENAGQCLVTYYQKDNRRIITVVLHSGDRIGETKQFTSWLLDNFNWESVTEKISYR